MDTKFQLMAAAGVLTVGIFGMMFATVLGDSLIYTLGLAGAWAIGKYS